MNQSYNNKLIESTCSKGLSFINWILSLYISLIASIIVTWTLTIPVVSWDSLLCFIATAFLIVGIKHTYDIHERYNSHKEIFIAWPKDKPKPETLIEYCKKEELMNNDGYKKRKRDYIIMYSSISVSIVAFLIVGTHSSCQNEKRRETLNSTINQININIEIIDLGVTNLQEKLKEQVRLIDSLKVLHQTKENMIFEKDTPQQMQ